MKNPNQSQKGIFLALLSYILWGFLPLFWHFLDKSTALQTLAHRILWSFIFIMFILAVKGKLSKYLSYFKQPKVIGFYTITGVLLAINWMIFIWAVGQERVLEASLGYFILPLINVFLGVLFLKERLRKQQWGILAIAAIGIIYLSLQLGELPWVALSLALTFSIYSLLKKQAPTDADFSVAFEMTAIVIPAILYLILMQYQGTGVFLTVDTKTTIMLITTGLITIIPILAYSTAVPLIPLSLAGLMFYLNPTLQFFTGAVILHEPFTQAQLIGYSIIWLALLLYFIEGFRNNKKNS